MKLTKEQFAAYRWIIHKNSPDSKKDEQTHLWLSLLWGNRTHLPPSTKLLMAATAISNCVLFIFQTILSTMEYTFKTIHAACTVYDYEE